MMSVDIEAGGQQNNWHCFCSYFCGIGIDRMISTNNEEYLFCDVFEPFDLLLCDYLYC